MDGRTFIKTVSGAMSVVALPLNLSANANDRESTPVKKSFTTKFHYLDNPNLLTRGSTTVIRSTTYTYKSSFLLTLFAQAATENNANDLRTDFGKKPMIIYISNEETIQGATNFLWRYFRNKNEYHHPDEDLNFDADMHKRADVIAELRKGGFVGAISCSQHITSVDHLRDLISRYTDTGYEVIGVFVDNINMFKEYNRFHSVAETSLLLLSRELNIMIAYTKTLGERALGLKRDGYIGHDLLREIAKQRSSQYNNQLAMDQVDLELTLTIDTTTTPKTLCVSKLTHDEPMSFITHPLLTETTIIPYLTIGLDKG